MRTPLIYASLESLITGAKEAKFPYFSKGKPVSSWLISKSSNIFLYKSLFCASNSWPAFCFVLSPRLSLITQRRHSTSSACTASVYHSQQKWEKSGFLPFEIWIFILQKRMDSLQEAFIHSPEPCEGHFITDARTLFHVFLTVDKKHPLTPLKGLEGPGQFLI